MSGLPRARKAPGHAAHQPRPEQTANHSMRAEECRHRCHAGMAVHHRHITQWGRPKEGNITTASHPMR
eukprot:8761129-Alexandrium_andersonii.AAC.1